MRILQPPLPEQANYHLPPQEWRAFNALRATALDADEHPILARHFWRGPLIVGGKLACNDSSPLARRFKTVPIVEVMEPGHGQA